MHTNRTVSLVVASGAVALYSCTYDYSKLRYSATTDGGAVDGPALTFEAGSKGEAGTGGAPASGGTIGGGGGPATGGSIDGGDAAAGTGGAMATDGNVAADVGLDLPQDVPLGGTDLAGSDLPGTGGQATTGGSSGGGASGTGGTSGTGRTGTSSLGGAGGTGGTPGSGGIAGAGGSAGADGSLPTPVFTELVADGYVRTEANAVSGDGRQVAGNATLAGGYIHALRWTDADFEELGTDVGWVAAYGKGISDDGSIVVGYVETRSSELAFRWDGQMHELLPLVSGGQYAQALGVSGDGRIVFGTSTDPSNDGVPVRWVDGGIQQLPLVQGHRTATPTGIDYDGGLIAGTGITTTGDENDAVRWPANGVFSLGLARSEAFAVSGDGRFILGAYMETVDLGPQHRTTFRWSASGFEYLPPTGTGQLDCLPAATNNDGAIVVGSCSEYTSTQTIHWFLWSEATGNVPLDQVLLELGVDTSRYTGFSITDISADGTTIIGNTSRNGVGMGFRAVIAGVFP